MTDNGMNYPQTESILEDENFLMINLYPFCVQYNRSINSLLHRHVFFDD